MRDILPEEVELRDAAVREIVAVYSAYGFRRIETPALENLRLLAGSGAGENEKLIFKVMKRGDELDAARRAGDELADLGLRFDLTVPLVRYYAENHARLPDPLKAIQIGPVWRAQRPPKGPYRRVTPCGLRVLRLSSPLVGGVAVLAPRGAPARPGPRGVRVTGLDHRDRQRGDAGRNPRAVRSHPGPRHGLLHGDDLRDRLARLPVVDRRRRPLRSHGRQAAGPRGARLRVLHRLRAARADPARAGRRGRPPRRRDGADPAAH